MFIKVLAGVVAITAVFVAAYGMIGASSSAPNLSQKMPVGGTGVGSDPGGVLKSMNLKPKAGDQLAAFSGGCFWGTEYDYRHVKGVVATAVGFTGGHVDHPSYEQVCTHTTGHAETVLVEFDPKVVTYGELLKKFWTFHDPTQLNRQGPDEGDNYRSAIWTFGDDQLKIAKASAAEDQKLEKQPITTEIAPIKQFWLAEDYHQQYDEKNGTNTCPAPRTPGQ